jgi:hypothetical protein
MSDDDHDSKNDDDLGFFARTAVDIERKYGDKLDRPAAPALAVDPAAARRQFVDDRAAALIDGRFPPRLVEVLRADKLAPTKALDHAAVFTNGDKTVLVLLGGTGAGKTLATCWIAQQFGGPRPGWIRAGGLERAGRYDRDLHQWIAERTLLVVDDLGVEFMDGKGAFLSVLDELVDAAWCRNGRLVLTSNLSVEAFAARYESRIWSRICDVGMVGNCGGKDLRRHAP